MLSAILTFKIGGLERDNFSWVEDTDDVVDIAASRASLLEDLVQFSGQNLDWAEEEVSNQITEISAQFAIENLQDILKEKADMCTNERAADEADSR